MLRLSTVLTSFSVVMSSINRSSSSSVNSMTTNAMEVPATFESQPSQRRLAHISKQQAQTRKHAQPPQKRPRSSVQSATKVVAGNATGNVATDEKFNVTGIVKGNAAGIMTGNVTMVTIGNKMDARLESIIAEMHRVVGGNVVNDEALSILRGRWVWHGEPVEPFCATEPRNEPGNGTFLVGKTLRLGSPPGNGTGPPNYEDVRTHTEEPGRLPSQEPTPKAAHVVAPSRSLLEPPNSGQEALAQQHAQRPADFMRAARRLAPRARPPDQYLHVRGPDATVATHRQELPVPFASVGERDNSVTNSGVTSLGNSSSWAMKSTKGHCEVVGRARRSRSCGEFYRNPCATSSCIDAFQDVSDFVTRTAFMGAVNCIVINPPQNGTVPNCTCFFPGLSECRLHRDVQISTFGDSTLRQFSLAWSLAAGPSKVVPEVIAEQENLLLGRGGSKVTAPLQQLSKWLFDVNQEDVKRGKVKLPEFYQPGNFGVLPVIPSKIRTIGRIAIFNYGLHLLGGVVDRRWKNPLTAAFFASLSTSYSSFTHAFVSTLRKRGFERVIYKNTNTIQSSNFHGSWKHAVDACSLDSPRRSDSKCRPFVESCVKGSSEAHRSACKHLSFDSEGSFNVNEISAASLLNRAPSVFVPNETFKLEPFFARPFECRWVDGLIDAQAVTQSHPEFCDDGRHYFQLELVHVRTLADAIMLWHSTPTPGESTREDYHLDNSSLLLEPADLKHADHPFSGGAPPREHTTGQVDSISRPKSNPAPSLSHHEKGWARSAYAQSHAHTGRNGHV
jgi:hypothetical protein